MPAVQVIALNFWMSYRVGLSLSPRSTMMKFSFPTAATLQPQGALRWSCSLIFFLFILCFFLLVWVSDVLPGTWGNSFTTLRRSMHSFCENKQQPHKKLDKGKTRISEPVWHSKIWGCELRKLQNKVQGCAFAKISVISQRCLKVSAQTRVGSHQAVCHIWDDTDRNKHLFHAEFVRQISQLLSHVVTATGLSTAASQYKATAGTASSFS